LRSGSISLSLSLSLTYAFIGIDERSRLDVVVGLEGRARFEAHQAQTRLVDGLDILQLFLAEANALTTVGIVVCNLLLHQQGASVVAHPFGHGLDTLIGLGVEPEEAGLFGFTQ
jgi:hypothetical protein